MILRVAAFLAVMASPAASQDISSRIPVGAEVDIRTRGSIQEYLRGRAHSVDSTRIRFSVTRAGSTIDLPWDRVSEVEWSRGRSRAYGLLDGVLLGALFGGANFVNAYPWGMTGSQAEERKRNLAVSSAVIFATASVIGLAVGSHRWKQVPLPPPRGGSVALQFAPDDYVKVESTRGDFIGRNAIAADSLRLTLPSGPVTFAWRHVGDLQVRGGKRRALGIVYGAGIALVVGAFAESFTDFTNMERVGHLAVGGALGFRFLSPEGWISLPQPSR